MHAVERFKAIVNNQAQEAALQIIAGLDKQQDELRERVLEDMRELKAHPERIADLVISDGDYELKPPKPVIMPRNGNDKRASAEVAI